jgi:DNA polymerase-3 subunit alpha
MNDRLLKLCLTQLYAKNLNNEIYKSRLKYELKQVSVKEDDEYFLDLYDKKVRYPYNQYNLLIAYLLGLVKDFDINLEASYEQGEMPDIDVDYIPQIQKYIKNDWAPKTFGERNVCSIGTVGALGIKSAILDMTKLHDLDKSEIQAITVSMEDKDDEGKVLDWDKAIELYPEFAKFCENNPLVAEDAKAMLDRSKSAGVHAGGLIISSVPIDDFVPLEVRKVDAKSGEGVVVSAWSEGLKTQDLQAVGLVKFDVLSIINLLQIAYIVKLIKERHPEVKSICALEGDSDWSDTSYLNDPVAIEMANRADLRCIFQFDSDGIRKLVQRGGVTSFDDLVAYTAIFRPGPLHCLEKSSKITINGGFKDIKDLINWSDEIGYLNKKGEIAYSNKFTLWKTGRKKVYKIRTKSGKELISSSDHRFLIEKEKYKHLSELKIGQKIAII